MLQSTAYLVPIRRILRHENPRVDRREKGGGEFFALFQNV
jgi:hypothetical protein